MLFKVRSLYFIPLKLFSLIQIFSNQKGKAFASHLPPFSNQQLFKKKCSPEKRRSVKHRKQTEKLLIDI